ncbi:MAG: hypothetical protein WC799_18565 [Desulfobacteraceae bacterium]|jgi:hypothetical protein
MNRFFILVLRIILGTAFAVLLTRIFHPEKGLVFIAGIAALLVGFSYFSSAMRNRKRKEQDR